MRAALITCLKLRPVSLERLAEARCEITEEIVRDALQKRILLYDKTGEEHYNLISALHKSVRNSDPDAALYWLGRMLEAGEDPLYVARRVVRMAVEDIGLADPKRLPLCMAARDAVDFIGMPEGNLALAQAVVYLSVAPKSNALYTAYGGVQQDVERTAAEPVPCICVMLQPAYERPGLWPRISVCPRPRIQSRRYAVPAGQSARSRVLPSPRMKASKSAFASVWRRSNASARAQKKSARRQKKDRRFISRHLYIHHMMGWCCYGCSSQAFST